MSGTVALATGVATVQMIAPAAASTAIIHLYDNSTLRDTVTVAFTAPVVPACLLITGGPTPSSIASSLGSGPSRITAMVLDSTNSPMVNQVVSVSANLGELLTNGAGYCVDSSVFVAADGATSCAEATDTSGQVSVDLFGGGTSGTSGTSTVTFAVGALAAR